MKLKTRNKYLCYEFFTINLINKNSQRHSQRTFAVVGIITNRLQYPVMPTDMREVDIEAFSTTRSQISNCAAIDASFYPLNLGS